jgi:hypothetical protein
MLLSCRMLNNVVDVNTFDHVSEVRFTQGDGPTVYFQLIDGTKNRIEDGFNPSGRRYMAATGATLSVLVDTLDDAKKITRVATQPFAQDPSVWALTFMATDTVRGTVVLRLTLTEGAKITRGASQIGAVEIDPQGSL